MSFNTHKYLFAGSCWEYRGWYAYTDNEDDGMVIVVENDEGVFVNHKKVGKKIIDKVFNNPEQKGYPTWFNISKN